jgi:hypothetical protein
MHEAQRESNRASSLSRVASSLGFRRIELVRILVRPTGATAVATGVVHRYPRTVPISMTDAGRLAAAGAPLRIDRIGEMPPMRTSPV